MHPLTLTKPKPMLELLGKPLLAYTFESLPDEINEVILVVGYLEDQIRNHFGEEFSGKKITYITQPKMTGTGGALLSARTNLSDERFVVLCADDLYSRPDIERLLKHELGALLSRAEDPSRFGVVLLDEFGRVVEIEEKPKQPKSNLISTGVFVLDNRIFNYEPVYQPSGESYLSEMVSRLTRDHTLVGEESEFWMQVGFPEDIVRAEKVLREKTSL